MKIYEPESLTDASAYLAENSDRARVIAGGTALTLMIKHGFTDIPVLVDIARLHDPGLRDIQVSASAITIGCLTTLDAIANSKDVREYIPSLAKACQAVGNPRIRNVATIGGCLAEADYASDPPTALIGLDAYCVLRSGVDRRRISVANLITGYLETDIRDGEILESVIIPMPSESAISIYERLRGRSAGDRPTLCMASTVDIHDGRISTLRVIAGAASYRPFYPQSLCRDYVSRQLDVDTIHEFAIQYAELIEPISDFRASGEYRTRLVDVTVRRQLTAAVALAAGTSG